MLVSINRNRPQPLMKEWGLKFLSDGIRVFQELFQLNFGTSLSKLLLEVFSFVFR